MEKMGRERVVQEVNSVFSFSDSVVAYTVRFVLHLFMHDIQTSFSLQKPPQITVTELKFSLPASRNLWIARTAREWQDRYLQERPPPPEIPSFMSTMQNPEILYTLSAHIDVPLSALALLHGFWGHIFHLHESRKLYPESKAAHRLCVLTEHGNLYRDLQDFSEKIPTLTNGSVRTSLIAELLMMSMHAFPEDLQRFAGKYGEAEASLAADEFSAWSVTGDARTAIWHAGQVFKLVKRLGPAQLSGFNAIAVYYASLTLWTYGLMMPSNAGGDSELTSAQRLHSWGTTSGGSPGPALNGRKSTSNDTPPRIILHESETPEVRTFRLTGEGIPGLHIPDTENDNKLEFVPLHDTNRILSVSRDLYRKNFLVIEPLPPLVDNLCALLRDLESTSGSGSAVRSREQSEGLGENP